MVVPVDLLRHALTAVGYDINFLNVTDFMLYQSILSGPYGEQDDEQLFVQQIVPDSDQLYVRLASTGKR